VIGGHRGLFKKIRGLCQSLPMPTATLTTLWMGSDVSSARDSKECFSRFRC